MVSRGSPDSQYFDPSPAAASKKRQIELILPDVYLDLTTDSGVFSASQVDKGTRYLLKDAPALDSLPSSPKSILDVGCGYGPIALTYAKRAPDAVVWGVDVNERAINLARDNADANSIANAHFGTDADIDPDLTFDLIVSNPPIRVGKAVLHEILSRWLTRLSPDGRAWLVVQKHLGSDSLANWMTEQGWPTTRLSSRAGFRVLETTARSES